MEKEQIESQVRSIMPIVLDANFTPSEKYEHILRVVNLCAKPVSPSEDKTAAKTIEKIIENRRDWLTENHIQDWNDTDTAFCISEYGTLRWNKAIEEAVKIASKDSFSIAHQISKLKV